MAATIPYYTVADLEHFPEDGNRYELLDGVLLVTPAPSAVHQRVASQLMLRLGIAVQHPGHAFVVGPGAISVPPRTQLEPDILVFPARYPIDAKWAEIDEHWLAVEILSRSSRMYDREFKRYAYSDLGVSEVWLVDTRDKCIEVSRARGSYETLRDDVTWRVPTLDIEVRIDLAELFAGVP